MPEPVHIAAIDAGSNAVRLSVARAYSALDIEPLITERYPLRLGEGVFVRHRFSEDILKKGVKAFRHLHDLPPDQRRSFLDGPQVQESFSPHEREILEGMNKSLQNAPPAAPNTPDQ